MFHAHLIKLCLTSILLSHIVLSSMYSVINFYFWVTLVLAIGMICQLKKQQSWPEDLFIMPHSEMEPVAVLLAVPPLSQVLKKILSMVLFYMCTLLLMSLIFSVYYVGPNGWKKLSGDDVGELHYKYYPVMPSTVEQEMVEVAGA